MDDASRAEYQHMARMPDRTKNKSYYAEMEVALLKRIKECRAKNETVTTQSIRDMARQELRRLSNNDEEKVNAFIQWMGLQFLEAKRETGQRGPFAAKEAGTIEYSEATVIQATGRSRVRRRR
jgi:hypothetical protein